MESFPKNGPLRLAAWVALVTGAVGCEYLMLRVGRRNPSPLLMAMFFAWVSTPFAALAWCQTKAKQWSESGRVALHATTLLVAISSLMIYGYVAFGPSRPQPAFFFLVLPLGSLALIAIFAVYAGKRRIMAAGERVDSSLRSE
jgi:hypothetical protein